MRIKLIPIISVAFLIAGVFPEPLRAQGGARISRQAAKKPGSILGLVDSERTPSGQYSLQDLEELRMQLLGLIDAIKDLGAIAPPELVDLDDLSQARAEFQSMPYGQLNMFRQVLSPSKIRRQLKLAREGIDAYARATPAAKLSVLAPKAITTYGDTTPFPIAKGFCGGRGPDRIPTSVVLGADIVFFAADSVRELAQDACKQVVAGVNTSGLCAPIDEAWVAAKAVNEGIHFCGDDLTGSIIDTNYARLDDIHTDVNNVGSTLDTHLTNVNLEIDTRIANLDTHLTNVDNHLTTLIANISNQISNLQALTLRLQIEANLARPGNSVSAFQTPASAGGYLELARSIVQDEIAAMTNIKSPNTSITSAKTEFQRGETQYNLKQYVAAYTYYQNAYILAASDK